MRPFGSSETEILLYIAWFLTSGNPCYGAGFADLKRQNKSSSTLKITYLKPVGFCYVALHLLYTSVKSDTLA